METYFNTADLIGLFDVARATLYRRIEAGDFPPPDAEVMGRKRWFPVTVRGYIRENGLDEIYGGELERLEKKKKAVKNSRK